MGMGHEGDSYAGIDQFTGHQEIVPGLESNSLQITVASNTGLSQRGGGPIVDVVHVIERGWTEFYQGRRCIYAQLAI